MPRVMLDANVLIAAFCCPRGAHELLGLPEADLASLRRRTRRAEPPGEHDIDGKRERSCAPDRSGVKSAGSTGPVARAQAGHNIYCRV
jgi:hypothetical protein